MAPRNTHGGPCCCIAGMKMKRAGIVVVKQITDEQKWFQAMERIQEVFMPEGYLEILPHFNKEAFNKITMKKFNLDEDMNFSRNGFQGIDWHWGEFPCEKDLCTLKLELSELKKKKEEFHKDEKYFGKYDQKILENLTKAVEFMENCECDDETKEIFQEILKRRVSLRVKSTSKKCTIYKTTYTINSIFNVLI